MSVVVVLMGVLSYSALALDGQAMNSLASAFSRTGATMPNSAFEIASAVDELSVLVEAVLGAGHPQLYEALAAPELENTVFAPTNEAFEKVADALGISLETFLSLPASVLADILMLHIVPNFSAETTELEQGQELETSSPAGLTITVSIDNDDGAGMSFVSVGSVAHVVPGAEDLHMGKSVIHVVDTVLLPFEVLADNEE